MKGILFKTWQAKLQALEEFGRAQTRRVEKGLEIINQNPDAWECQVLPSGIWTCRQKITYPGGFYFSDWVHIKPRYHIDEGVYVKEAWKVDKKFDSLPPRDLPSGLPLVYPFGGDPADEISIPDCYGRLRSPLHLREEDARYFVLMLVVKLQRVQEITERECFMEGIKPNQVYIENIGTPREERTYIPRIAFQWLWDSINKDYPWESNPWEFTYELARLKGR